MLPTIIGEKPLKAGRMLVKRVLLTLLGKGGTGQVHGLYHALLRRTGAFGLTETAATQDLLGTLAGEAKTILDIGANIGRYSWFMAQRRRDGVPLYGFEPNPEAYRLAHRNLAGISKVTLLPVGLGDRDQDATLAVPHDSTGTPVSGLGFILGDRHTTTDSETQAVILKTLDGLIAQGAVQVSSPILLKIDIEGYEPAALVGMTAFLANHRPWIFFECEVHHLRRAGYDWPDVFGPLHRLGYHIVAETEGRFVPVSEPITGVANYFALVPETIPAAASQAIVFSR